MSASKELVLIEPTDKPSPKRKPFNHTHRFEDMTLWGQNITVLRLAKDWRIEELASRAGIGRNTLVRMVYGHGESSLEKLGWIAGALGVRTYELLLEPEELMDLKGE